MKLISESILTFLLLCIVIIFIVSSLKYESTARLVPLIVGIPTLFLVFIQFLLEIVPSFSKFRKNIEGVEFFGKTKILQEQKLGKEENKQKNNKKSGAEKNILLWIIFLVFAIWLMGFLIAIPLFIILFFSLNNIFKLYQSILISLATTTIVYILFDKLLGLTLYKGLLSLYF